MKHRDCGFTNPQTREAFFEVLQGCRDPCTMAASWSDMGAGDAAEMLAKQLREDLQEEFVVDHPFFRTLMLPGFRRIDFVQIAQRLLQLYGPQEPAAQEGDTQSG